MGSLTGPDGVIINLPARTLVGRAPKAELALQNASVSWEHAMLIWRGENWEIRDLGSRNGTFVDSRRLGAGLRLGLQRGARLAFGRLCSDYVLNDDGAPQLFAQRWGDGLQVAASAGVLGLPSARAPVVQIMHLGGGRWIACSESGVTPVEDGQVLIVRDERWELFLPILAEETHGSDDSNSIAGLTLSFLVSRDEETIFLELESEGNRVRLRARTHNYLLLYLARRRLADEQLPEQERGWIARTDLAHALRLGSEHINVQLFRLREAFARAGLVDPGNLIESRQSPNQVRLGLGQLRIRAL